MNNPFHYYILMFKKYADFRGRARRREYWYSCLSSWIICVVLAIANASFRAMGLDTVCLCISIIELLLGLASILPAMAVSVRRMHDIDRSGWWILVPIVNFVFCCSDSDPQTNRFGPSPKPKEGMSLQREGSISSVTVSADDLDKIEKLARLRDQGILTEEEFQRKKKELL